MFRLGNKVPEPGLRKAAESAISVWPSVSKKNERLTAKTGGRNDRESI